MTDPTLFCYGAIGWSISESVYDTLETRDALAKADYKALLTKWNANTDKLLNPTNDCLAIARNFY
eukprot:CAMPEP_0168318436 /NCGR_PEP_ID=MMETSP0213-20121227/482_1 /TAXON_ID=151035 /ORGANISM="Euplotes harpa, Strain FSP1.4" /LENGTH=64 /DNA_ID=CAMNT_0008319511 /DNA_START=248 /DNA_END=442 /DNA_ORIENTATION=-